MWCTGLCEVLPAPGGCAGGALQSPSRPGCCSPGAFLRTARGGGGRTEREGACRQESGGGDGAGGRRLALPCSESRTQGKGGSPGSGHERSRWQKGFARRTPRGQGRQRPACSRLSKISMEARSKSWQREEGRAASCCRGPKEQQQQQRGRCTLCVLCRAFGSLLRRRPSSPACRGVNAGQAAAPPGMQPLRPGPARPASPAPHRR